MLRKIIYCFLLLSISMTQKAQQPKKKCSCSFSSINQAGLTAGELKEAFLFQTVNGLRYKSWFSGIGVGIDDYRYRSIPVFLQLRKDLFKKTNTVFLYNDIGLNFPWLKKDQKISFLPSNFEDGLYYDGGIGYKVGSAKYAVFVSGGFSLKELREYRTTNLCGLTKCEETRDRYHYSLRRISFKLGLQF